jgi:hypothetical protein
MLRDAGDVSDSAITLHINEDALLRRWYLEQIAERGNRLGQVTSEKGLGAGLLGVRRGGRDALRSRRPTCIEMLHDGIRALVR